MKITNICSLSGRVSKRHPFELTTEFLPPRKTINEQAIRVTEMTPVNLGVGNWIPISLPFSRRVVMSYNPLVYYPHPPYKSIHPSTHTQLAPSYFIPLNSNMYPSQNQKSISIRLHWLHIHGLSLEYHYYSFSDCSDSFFSFFLSLETHGKFTWCHFKNSISR